MSRIQLLPPQVIAAIAAGEIAERPAVILKELIENSLDAGATSLSIEIEDSGLTKISIADNGVGMTSEEIPLAIQRHTTSKIANLTDLENICSFGFRGEALASMASISQLEIISKHVSETTGSHLTVLNDQIISQQPIGRATGTTIIITQLFAALPARLKFLQHRTTEWRLLADVVSIAAMSQPEVGFWLRHNQKVVMSVPAEQTLIQRLTSLYGDSVTSQLTPLSYQHQLLNLSGFIGKPQIARRSKDQFLSINRRPILHPKLNRHIKYAYGTLLEARLEPFFVIDIQIDPRLIDINVHPRKETVRFIDEKQILEIVHAAVTQALTQADPTYAYGSNQTSPLLAFADSAPQSTDHLRSDRTQSFTTSQTLKQLVASWQLQPQNIGNISQVHQTYLITETPQGLVMIDQHAAHERILFEQYSAMYKQEVAAHPISTPLPTPVVMTLQLSDSSLLVNQQTMLTEIGFQIESFGTTSFKITHVPSAFSDHDISQTIRDILDDLRDDRPLAGIDRATERTLAFLACRHAIKAGDFLTQDQRRELISKLTETPNNTTCPHGRPVSITYSLNDLELLFKRH